MIKKNYIKKISVSNSWKLLKYSFVCFGHYVITKRIEDINEKI